MRCREVETVVVEMKEESGTFVELERVEEDGVRVRGLSCEKRY